MASKDDFDQTSQSLGKIIHIVQIQGHTLFSGHHRSIVKDNALTTGTLKKTSPEPLDQFQPNLEQSILGQKKIKFVQTKTYNPLQAGDNKEIDIKIYMSSCPVSYLALDSD